MMFRPITAADQAAYLQMAHSFYQSDAVDHPIPDSYIENTFQNLMTGSPFSACYLFEAGGQPAGYALLALTWSQEAGGLAVWVEELYVLPQFRGHSLGRSFLEALPSLYPHAARFRLEVEGSNKGAVALYQRLGYIWLEYQQMVLDCPLKTAKKADKI